jgi:hypothetical protein
LLGIAIIASGYMYFTAGAKPQNWAAAKNMLKVAIIGGIIILGVGVIVNTTRTFTENPLQFFQ